MVLVPLRRVQTLDAGLEDAELSETADNCILLSQP